MQYFSKPSQLDQEQDQKKNPYNFLRLCPLQWLLDFCLEELTKGGF